MKKILLFGLIVWIGQSGSAQKTPKFSVIGFFTAQNDQAHISFVHEANRWFYKTAQQKNFTYDSTNNWDNLNAEFLTRYDVVIFLDTRPESEPQRKAFQEFIEKGGAWMGFHFAGFALTPSGFPQNWDWYHNKFLGAGQYVSNTWRPTSAVLRTFKSSPCEWYQWEKDLRTNPDIKILLSIDPSSFPLGTGPKQHEIWRSGYYPVAWTNTKYKMVYFNMGHNDIDYEGKTNKTLSYTFGNSIQDKLILNSLLWLGSPNKKK
jgi:uncharacterized protein